MFETLGLGELGPRVASLWLGLAVGGVFGALALASGLCFRRAIAGPRAERLPAAAVWATALAVAAAGTQAAVALGWIGFGGHRFVTPALPWMALVGGGAVFGVGMVLTRGCPARLTVLAASGNLRAAVTLLVFAVVALATLRGALSPVRQALAQATLPGPGLLPGMAGLWVAGLAAVAVALAVLGRPGRGRLAMAAGIGLLVPVAWIGTGLVLADDFDPIPFEGLSFTGPWADGLFWAVASVRPGFGAGLVAGTVAGALALALVTRQWRWQGFAGPAEMGRYLTGAAMMGVGGAAAGGCTIGAGLAGVPTLGAAAALALVSIALGGAMAAALDGRVTRGTPSAAP